MRRLLALLIALLAFVTLGGAALAQETGLGDVERIATRAGVSVPIYAYWRQDALATVVLYSGGAGGYGPIGGDGWPAGGNFLIRTGKHWATYPFNIVMVGRPSDGIDLSLGNVRTGDQHGADNVALFRAIKARSAAPIWLVGTSMGTISAAAAAIGDEDRLLSGLVLTSSIVAYKADGALPKQKLDKIRVPTLVFHHADDACWACRVSEARKIESELINAPIKKTIVVSGGEGASGSPCEARHYHGYIGMEEEAVDRIAAWIRTSVQ